MKRFCGVAITAVALAAIPVAISGQGTAGTTKKAPAAQNAAAPKTPSATGTVSAVAPDSITVKGKTDTWTFTIDSKTEVIAKGATHKTLALKSDGKASMLTDFVKNGDSVTVTYHDMGGTKHAASIRVTSAGK